MRRYLIVPSDYSPDNIPPGRLASLHKRGPSELNADIVIIENGIEIARYMYRNALARKLDAELPEVTETVRTESGEVKEVTLGKEEPPALRKGSPPLHSLLYLKCDWETGLEDNEVVEVVEELGWFEELEKSTKKIVTEELEYMADEGLMTYLPEKETWHAGPRRLSDYYELGEDGYDIEPGPYPVVRLIRDVAEGSVRKRKLIETVYDWYTKTRNSAKFWMGHALEMEYIKEIAPNVVESYRTIQS